MKSKQDIYRDKTVPQKNRSRSEPALPPCPPDADEPDFESGEPHRNAGFSTVPGAGPNPTAPEHTRK